MTPVSHHIKKSRQNRFNTLKVVSKTVKLLIENIGEILQDIFIAKFLEKTPKPQRTGNKTNKVKRQPTEWKEIFAN